MARSPLHWLGLPLDGRDYDGEEVYGDYTVTATKTWDEQEQVWVYGPPELHNVAAYLPGVGQMDSQTGAVTYHHADHLG